MVGGQAAMSRNLGVSSPTVNQWTTGIRQIPTERCPEIEKTTGGSVNHRTRKDTSFMLLYLHFLGYQ